MPNAPARFIPAPEHWSAALAPSTHPDARDLRAQLGLPTDRPVILSGHQAQFWHAGILAKALAADALARRTGATWAWVVVDQDASDSASLPYPARAHTGALPARHTWAFAPERHIAELRADCALANLPAFTPAPAPTDAATPDVQRGLRAMHDALARHAAAPTCALQIARANADLLATLLPPTTPAPPTAPAQGVLITACTLLHTRAGRALLERMMADPEACVRAYNRAVADTARHDLSPLSLAPERGRIELPLWQLAPGTTPAPRKRVYARTLSDAPLHTLAPRALLMTALLRHLACDLFIHGTGGGASATSAADTGAGYDRAAERWFQLWLGEKLAPSVVATADVLLPLPTGDTGEPIGPTVQPQDVLDARALAHRARHHPGLLGDHDAQQARDALVEQIRALTSARGQAHAAGKRALYRQLHELLSGARARHAPALDALHERAGTLARTLQQEAILRERAWPWPVLPRARLLALRAHIQHSVGGGGGGGGAP
jgi:hypothetical protein